MADLKTLGDQLDAADREAERCACDEDDATLKAAEKIADALERRYRGAKNRAVVAEVRAMQNDKTFRPDAKFCCRLNAAIIPALAKSDGPHRWFRDEIDDNAAYELAWRLNNAAVERWTANLERDRAERVRNRGRPKLALHKKDFRKSRARASRSLAAMME